MMKKRGLGRGLEALLGSETKPDVAMDEIPVEFISPGPFQPRKNFPEDALNELAESIKRQGIVQPIVVREGSVTKYEIIAGERRWRAAQRAALETVPVVVKQVSDESAIAMSLIENIQREDLNPMEEAEALNRLLDEFQLSHQELADAVGKSRVAVTNYLRLNGLSSKVKDFVISGALEMGHARALLSLSNADQDKLANEVILRGLNVRETEALVRRKSSNKPKNNPSTNKTSDTRQLEQKLGDRIGQPVNIQHSAKGRGKLIINYNSLDELDGILSHFGELE
ncbi:MAG: ParB/RepB/Spo0J family partition protein [OM182 bacterium]|uniref:Probable chromosome-partitioning protein ParB n=1 Tax=OM182 bacterium TaxID=2510334 RepID=A0A520S5U1_9GAMM|nr:MAG: ParB/RepB/Spo0J family partition protein [OM182 bacterium]